jgi:adenine-specific DNA-methyltransferase
MEASSNAGDLVLDCFSGSGTTLSVASHLGRSWIGMDNSREAIGATLRRFGQGLEPMGDFVSEQGTTAPGGEPEASLPLFGPDQIGKPYLKNASRHRIIKDFTFFAQEPCQGELDSLLGQWAEWIGETKLVQIHETGPEYRVHKTKERKRSRS